MRTGRLVLVFLIVSFTVCFAQVNTESLRGKGSYKGFKGKIGAGFESHSGNTEYTQSQANMRIDYYATSWESFLVGSYVLGEKSDERFLHKGFAHWRSAYKIIPILSAEAFFQEEFNEFIKLNHRFLGGSGVRYSPMAEDSSTTLQLAVGIGLMYETENVEVEVNRDQSFNRVKSTNYLSLSWTMNQVTLGAVQYYQFDVEDAEYFRLLGQMSAAMKITDHFNIKMSYDHRFDSHPYAEGVKKYDATFKNSLEFSF